MRKARRLSQETPRRRRKKRRRRRSKGDELQGCGGKFYICTYKGGYVDSLFLQILLVPGLKFVPPTFLDYFSFNNEFLSVSIILSSLFC